MMFTNWWGYENEFDNSSFDNYEQHSYTIDFTDIDFDVWGPKAMGLIRQVYDNIHYSICSQEEYTIDSLGFMIWNLG